MNLRHAIASLPARGAAVLVLAVASGADAQVIEAFAAEAGLPAFAEQPVIVGTQVLWTRAPERLGGPARLQCRDVAIPGSEVVDLFRYPTSRLMPLVSDGWLFRHDFDEEGYPLYAQELIDSCSVSKEKYPVHVQGGLVAVNRSYLFSILMDPEGDWNNFYGVVCAKPRALLHDPDLLSSIPIAVFESYPQMSRVYVASESHLARVDRPVRSEVDPKTWRVYVHSMASIASGEPERVIDTGAPKSESQYGQGVYIDLAGSLLVYQGRMLDGEEAGADGLFLVDLSDPASEPIPIALTKDDAVRLTWPSVSPEYVVWAEATHFFYRKAMGVRLVDGAPSGEIFTIGPGGSWITVRGNLAASNGRTVPTDGTPSEDAILVWELETQDTSDVGDADADGELSLTDAVIILQYLFASGPQPRVRLADFDRNGRVNLTDAIGLLKTLFQGGD